MDDNKFLPKLSQNLLEILNEEFYDVTIEVGSDPYVKILRSHAVILYYRSPYLQRILSTNKKKNDGTLIHIKLPNISPEIFQIILRYIYGGKLSLEEHDASDIVKILVAANELSLQDLIPHLQSFLIKSKSNWMEQNFDLIYKTSFENDSFSDLQKYCTDLISKEPDKLFNSLNSSSISEKLLVMLIQGDNLQMSDIQVWENVLKWGLAQKPALPSDIKNFSKEDFNTLKNSLQQCVPFIKFYNLTSEEFSDRVLPYKKALPKELREDLIKYFLSLKQSKSCITEVIKETSQDTTSTQAPSSSHQGSNNPGLTGYLVNWYQKATNDGKGLCELGMNYQLGLGVNKDKIKAFEYYKMSAEKEYLIAQFRLGFCYDNGIGTEVNKEKAFEFYKKAADNGYLDAQFELGSCYLNGIGTEINKMKAFESYKIVAEKGNSKAQGLFGPSLVVAAQYKLGIFYELGIGVSKDEIKAVEYYKMLAEKKDSNAQFRLGFCYDNGIGTEVNKEKAFELYKKAALKGNNFAQTSLGYLYSCGQGTNKDVEKAVYWMQKAAEKGELCALYNLGACYEFGIGISKDEIKAFEYYKKSSENGYFAAKFCLGYCYVNGIGTKVDRGKGFELYNEAANKENMIKYCENNDKILNNLDKVNHWYHKAAENDNKFALYKLGEFHELGKGVYRSKRRAFEFYKKSADQGFVDAQYKLGYFYSHGIEIDINKEKAFEYYNMAAKGGNVDAQRSLASLSEQG